MKRERDRATDFENLAFVWYNKCLNHILACDIVL